MTSEVKKLKTGSHGAETLISSQMHSNFTRHRLIEGSGRPGFRAFRVDVWCGNGIQGPSIVHIVHICDPTTPRLN